MSNGVIQWAILCLPRTANQMWAELGLGQGRLQDVDNVLRVAMY